MFRQKGIVIALSALMTLLIVLSVLAIRLHLSRIEPDDHKGYKGYAHAKSGQIEPSDEKTLSGDIINGVRVVKMKARQFEFEPNQIVVNTGEKVRLEITSEDVTHGFELDEFDIERQLPPDKTVSIDFTAKKAGKHTFYCSVFCGHGHDEMQGELIILPADK